MPIATMVEGYHPARLGPGHGSKYLPHLQHGNSTVMPSANHQIQRLHQNQRILDKNDPVYKTQLLLDRDVVSAAIEDVIQASEKAQKRPHTELDVSNEQAQPAKIAKKNAFSSMMSSRQEPTKWTYEPVTLQSPAEFERILSGQHLVLEPGQQHDWAAYMANAIDTWYKLEIQPHIGRQAHLQTKISALHLLIEIATGIAYTAGSKISQTMSHNRALNDTLTNNIYNIVASLSVAESKKLVDEKHFIAKLKRLRQDPVVPWEGGTWNKLDEVMRITKDPGPVDFRTIYAQILGMVQGLDDAVRPHYFRPDTRPSSISIVRIIREDILSRVTRSACSETKYNALNTLVDVGVVFMEHHKTRRGLQKAHDALFQAMSSIGELFNEDEVALVVSEVLAANPNAELDSLSNHLASFGLPQHDSLASSRGALTGIQHQHQSQMRLRKLKDDVVVSFTVHTSKYCEKGLWNKILFLRYYSPSAWATNSLNTLDSILLLFPDRSRPLQPQIILQAPKYKHFELIQQAVYHRYQDQAELSQQVRKTMDFSISRIGIHATKGTSVDVKLSALKILAELGPLILDCFQDAKPQWQKKIFEDHFSEDTLTDTMLRICHSLGVSDWPAVMADQSLMNAVELMDSRRSQIPESMDGLDAVLAIIRDPHHTNSSSSRSAQRKRAKTTASKVGDIPLIDLTKDSAGDIPFIDLTED